jgi:hypothetical protein
VMGIFGCEEGGGFTIIEYHSEFEWDDNREVPGDTFKFHKRFIIFSC